MTARLTDAALALLASVQTENAGDGVVLEHSDERHALLSRRLIERAPSAPREPTRYVLTPAGSSALSEGRRIWPATLTPVLLDVLSLMVFELGGPAHVYRAAGEFLDGDGQPLKPRAENEQAFMLHKLIGFALEHPTDWIAIAHADLARAREKATAK